MKSVVSDLFGYSVKKRCGIYCALHRASGMCCVGSSNNIHRRIQGHLQAVAKMSFNLFHRAIREFGVDAFEFSILEECQEHELFIRERFYIAFFNATSDGFNSKADPSGLVKVVGRKRTPEQCAAQSALLRSLKMKRTEETKQRISDALKGSKKSPEHRSKIRAFRTGMLLSEAHKKSIGAALIGRIWKPESRKKQTDTWRKNYEGLGPSFADHRKPIIATDQAGNVLHVFESLLEAVEGLEMSNGNIRYYLNTGGKTKAGLFLFYATLERNTPAPA